MTTTAPHTSHLDAIRPLATHFGYTEIHDSGPCLDGKLVIFADPEHAYDYLNGPGVLGTWIEVNLDCNGELDHARLMIDNARVSQVAPGQGTPGERLVWTAQMFIENPVNQRDGSADGAT